MNTKRMPGFHAESSLGTATGTYGGAPISGDFPSGGGVKVEPQLRFQSDPDIGSYLRCRANGGSELICRFFGGLPPFTIGRLTF